MSYRKRKNVLTTSKVTLLDNSYVEIDNVLFGGIPSERNGRKIDTRFLSDFGNMPGYKILLCHHPEYYPLLKKYSIDLIISGHCHGGQIRVFNHGIFAPGQGVFPKYHHGVYDGRLVVSAGCSNTSKFPGGETILKL